MTHWIRFQHAGATGFGTLEDDRIAVHDGDMFKAPRPTGEVLSLDRVTPLTPTAAGKMLALWNNFRGLAAKLDQEIPPEPLYFIKANSSYLANGGVIRKPPSYDGKVVFEGELGIVIGRQCRALSEAEASDYIFGYTCINDVTAVEIIGKDATFAQWTRAKSFDTFGVFGPVVATGLNPSALSIRTVLNDQERQNYPVSDMIFPPPKIVSMISQDMTLEAGDVICCGTSIGVGSMKPGSTITVTIEGIGTLGNRYENLDLRSQP
jgi:2-keto-4-pentenoate hydratase/2-oxohepta-3-ene-1,7-dioic acid hydratase in catechol pathway